MRIVSNAVERRILIAAIRFPIRGETMRCMTCGRENPENATFCGSCGSRVGSSQMWPQQGQPLGHEPAKKDLKVPLILLVLGIVMIVVGIITYAWAISSAVHTVGDTDPMDPFGTMHEFAADAGLMMASYAVMAIGGLIAFVGFILLILKLV